MVHPNSLSVSAPTSRAASCTNNTMATAMAAPCMYGKRCSGCSKKDACASLPAEAPPHGECRLVTYLSEVMAGGNVCAADMMTVREGCVDQTRDPPL